MLMLTVHAEMPLAAPTADSGFVTWLDVSLQRQATEARETIGRARVALIHVGDAMNRGAPMHDVLDADSGMLAELLDVFFEPDDYLKEEFSAGIGFNVLFFAAIELMLPWQRRLIEEALIRRMSDAWGDGCAIAVLPVQDSEEIKRWRAMGFQVARPPTKDRCGYVYLDLSVDLPDLDFADELGERFVISTPPGR